MQPFSDEDASIDSLSHCSSFSDAISVADEGNVAVYTCVMQLHVPLFEHVGGWVCVCWLCCKWAVFCFFNFFLSACAVSPVLSEATAQASVDLRRLGVLPGGESSEDAAQEDFQYKLKGFIDSTVDKR